MDGATLRPTGAILSERVAARAENGRTGIMGGGYDEEVACDTPDGMIEQRPAPGLPRLDDPIPVPWRVKDALQGVGLVIVGTVLVFLALDLFVGGDGTDYGDPAMTVVIGLLPMLMLVSAWLFGVRRHRAPWRALGFSRPRTSDILVLPWLVLFLSLFSFTLYTLLMDAWSGGSFSPPSLPDDALGEGVYKSLNLAAIGLLGPIAEEVFFRGFLLASLVRPLGVLRAAAVSSAVFAVSHGSLGLVAPVFVSGMLLSWLYIKTRSIWPPFAAHAAQNILALNAIMASA